MTAMEIAPYQQRVLDELFELHERITKLGEFIRGPVFGQLESEEKTRLLCQQHIMKAYRSILTQRLAAMGLSDRLEGITAA